MFYVFPRVISANACDKIVKDCKQNILNEATVYNTEGTSLRDHPEVRKTSVSFIKDRDNEINELVWHYLREANKILFNYNLDFFQPIQFAQYSKGCFYDWHQDEGRINKSNEVRKLSLTLVLSNPDNFEGGKLEFYNGGRSLQDIGEITGEQVLSDIQAQGTVVVFDSRDWHRVTPIKNGVRYSIVCWTVGANFK